MPKSFWAEAMATAAYLINRLPSNAIDGRIPYELWHNKALTSRDLQALKPFGCLVHSHVPEQRRKTSSKVDPRSTEGCFVGYLDTTTMHRIWDFERKCFVNSHDLIFEETQFRNPQTSTSLQQIHTIMLLDLLHPLRKNLVRYSMKLSCNHLRHFKSSLHMEIFNQRTILLHSPTP